ncbi:aldolase/citrate lyase family protein [Streptomyces sp. NPDC059373]
MKILLETPAGIANADGIARLDGVDIIAIGANDFTAELDRYHELGVRTIRLDLFARASWPLDDLIAYIRSMGRPGRGHAAGTSSSTRRARSCGPCCRSSPVWRTPS